MDVYENSSVTRWLTGRKMKIHHDNQDSLLLGYIKDLLENKNYLD